MNQENLKVLDLWAIALAVDGDYAYITPEIKETIAATETAQSDQSDWVSRGYRRIG